MYVVLMYVCVCMYVCMYVCLYVCACMYVPMYAYMHLCINDHRNCIEDQCHYAILYMNCSVYII